jgi:hypothetical protein
VARAETFGHGFQQLALFEFKRRKGRSGMACGEGACHFGLERRGIGTVPGI